MLCIRFREKCFDFFSKYPNVNGNKRRLTVPIPAKSDKAGILTTCKLAILESSLKVRNYSNPLRFMYLPGLYRARTCEVKILQTTWGGGGVAAFEGVGEAKPTIYCVTIACSFSR